MAWPSLSLGLLVLNQDRHEDVIHRPHRTQRDVDPDDAAREQALDDDDPEPSPLVHDAHVAVDQATERGVRVLARRRRWADDRLEGRRLEELLAAEQARDRIVETGGRDEDEV